MEAEQLNSAPAHSIPAWKLEKIKAKEEKLQAKVVKFGVELQVEELRKQGFVDTRKVLKALKKSKGDLASAISYLTTTPAEGDKPWKKYLKEVPASHDECHKVRKGRTPSQEAKKLEKRMKKLSTGDSSEESKPRKFKQERTPEEEFQRKEKKHINALARMQEKMPQFVEFNKKMIALGFNDVKKNFSALKKKEGNEELAALHLKLKQNLENLILCESLSKKPFKKLYLDCNNCFYLDQAFLKKATNGNFKEIEEKITILMKLFQNKYGSPIQIVLVFDNSKLIKDEKITEMYVTPTFEMITARPKFESADDLLVSLASSVESNEDSIFVTSDRMLQARLVNQKVSHIMASKVLFSELKNDYIGKREFAAVVEV